MKEVVAIIRPHKLDEVFEVLRELTVEGATAAEVKGFGRTLGKKETARRSAYVVGFVPKVQISLVLPDALVDAVVARVVAVARSGKMGDGKVFVSSTLAAFRIRTGEQGDIALHSTATSRQSRSPGTLELTKVVAIIKPFKLNEVVDGLTELGIQGLTLTEVKGFGRTGGKKEVYRGSAYVVDFVPKCLATLVVPATMAIDVANVILERARTGRIGDGKLFMSPVENAVRISTGEQGLSAVWTEPGA